MVAGLGSSPSPATLTWMSRRVWMKSSQQKIRELWEDNNGKLIITRIHPQYYHVIRTDITFIFFSLTTQKSPLFLLSTSQCDALHHISSTITSLIICVLLQHFSLIRWCFLKLESIPKGHRTQHSLIFTLTPPRHTSGAAVASVLCPS